MGSPGSSVSARTAASIPAGSSIGSSPCTFTTISDVDGSRRFREAVGPGGVIAVRSGGPRPPKARTAAAIRSSSVATRIRSRVRAPRTRSWTRWMRVFPWMSERGFPGRRVDAKRAGMIATMAKSLGALV